MIGDQYVLILLAIGLTLLKPVMSADTSNKTSLKIVNGLHTIKEFNLTFLNNKEGAEYSEAGTVWHFTSKDDLIELIDKYLVISHNFVFVFDNVNLFKLFNSLSPQNIIINGLIISNTSEFNAKETHDIIMSSNYSVFMFENSSIDMLFPFDIREEDSNYFFFLYYSLIIYRTLLNYVKWLSLACLVFSLILPILWNLKLKFCPEDSLFFLQRIVVFLPYLNVILCGLLTFQMFSLKDNGAEGILNNSNIYIETVLVTVRAIFRTVLWFFIILVASGWQLIMRSLSREDIKSYIKIYVFIYIVICVDQIVDAFSGKVLKIFYPSELKNIIFYLLMALGVLKKGMKTLKFFKTKLNYARLLSREYIPSLDLKYKMIFWHIGGVLIYFFAYCFVLTVQKVCFREYNVPEFILINYHMLDIMLIVYYMVIYHPRSLPRFFNIEYGGEEEGEEILGFKQIYNAKIPNINEVAKEGRVIVLSQPELFDFNQDNAERKKPIVVIHPVIIQPSDVNTKTINLIINSLSIGYNT